ncbi:MAG: hypothetical protein E6Q97_09155 [Desulfurellales bacterium]|nr:MAG: hypothetical protein E6Q97_09155 [Desulfurellales bacterium]
MADLPASGVLGDSAIDVADFQTEIENLRDFVAELPGGAARYELTIASGSVTPPAGDGGGVFTIDTEGNAASDDLTNIVTTNTPIGRVVRLQMENTARIPTLKHGSGNLSMYDSQDFVFMSAHEWIEFQLRATTWVETDRRIDDCLCSVYRTATQTLPANTPTKIVFDGEYIDAANAWDPTNGYFTAPVKGWYEINGGFGIVTQSAADGTQIFAALYKDTGSGFAAFRSGSSMRTGGAGTAPRGTVADTVPLNAGDKIAMYAYVLAWVSGTGDISTSSFMNIKRVR